MQDTNPSETAGQSLPEYLSTASRGPDAESLTELAYRRAREALEQAMEEARSIRLQALEDARGMRLEETAALARDLDSHRRTANAEMASLIRQAEVEAERIRAEANRDAAEIVRAAKAEAQQTAGQAFDALVEARTVRVAADERQREIERLEAEFNQLMSEFARRAGLAEEPSEGWWKRLTGRDRKR